jgi:hypothetical protein
MSEWLSGKWCRRYLERFLHFGKLVFKVTTRSDLPGKQNMRQQINKEDRNILTYTLRISARLVPPAAVLPIPAPPEASVGVGETTPVRLGGLERTLGPVFPRLVVRARAITLGPDVDPDPFESVEGVFPNSVRLGGTYSFFPPDWLSSLLAAEVRLLVEADKTWPRTESMVAFRTPFLAISFLRSARAASVTPGLVNSSTSDCFAHSRTLLSLSSRTATRDGRYDRRANEGCDRRI